MTREEQIRIVGILMTIAGALLLDININATGLTLMSLGIIPLIVYGVDHK